MIRVRFTPVQVKTEPFIRILPTALGPVMVLGGNHIRVESRRHLQYDVHVLEPSCSLFKRLNVQPVDSTSEGQQEIEVVDHQVDNDVALRGRPGVLR